MKCEWQHAKAGRFPHKVPGTENAKDVPVQGQNAEERGLAVC